MKSVIMALIVTVAISSSALAHRGYHHHEEREIEPGIRLDFDVTYLNPLGHTIADGTGLHFYHDYQSTLWGLPYTMISHDPTVLPSRYWGSYPLYYSGATMNYTIKITNTGFRKFKNLTVVAIQEYLSPTGEVNTRIGSDAVRDWFIPKLDKRETKTLLGSIAIPLLSESGLDQTHIQVFRSYRHNDEEKQDENEREEVRWHHHGQESASLRSRLIYENIQEGIWCPPASQPTKPQ